MKYFLLVSFNYGIIHILSQGYEQNKDWIVLVKYTKIKATD